MQPSREVAIKVIQALAWLTVASELAVASDARGPVRRAKAERGGVEWRRCRNPELCSSPHLSIMMAAPGVRDARYGPPQ